MVVFTLSRRVRPVSPTDRGVVALSIAAVFVALLAGAPAVQADGVPLWSSIKAKFSGDDNEAATARARGEQARPEIQAADALFEQKEYSKAARAFKRIAKEYKDTPAEEEALFKQAEAHFKDNQLPEAQDTYAGLLTKYPTTRYLPQAIQRTYDIAYIWLEDSRLRSQGQPGKHSSFSNRVNLLDSSRPFFDTNGRAVKAIETIQQFDPVGPLTDDAVMMAGAYRFVNGDYIQAASYYEQLVTDQPKSEHAVKAMMLGAQAYMRSYQGPDYDGNDLDSAERLTKAALARSAELSAEERDRLERDLRVIRLEQAKRHFTTAEHYAKLRKTGSARYYYSMVLNNYGDTDWARRAEEQLKGTIGGPPNERDAEIALVKASVPVPPERTVREREPEPDSERPGMIRRVASRLFRRGHEDTKSSEDNGSVTANLPPPSLSLGSSQSSESGADDDAVLLPALSPSRRLSTSP